MIKTVFRLFYTYKRRWMWIFQHEQVGKDFQCTVGHLLRIKRVMETSVVETKEQSPIGTPFRVNAFDAWNFPGNVGKNAFESVRMFTLHKLNDIAKVVTMHVQMSLGAGQWQTARSIGRKIAQVPSLDKLPKRRNPGMLLQGTKGCNT